MAPLVDGSEHELRPILRASGFSEGAGWERIVTVHLQYENNMKLTFFAQPNVVIQLFSLSLIFQHNVS